MSRDIEQDWHEREGDVTSESDTIQDLRASLAASEARVKELRQQVLDEHSAGELAHDESRPEPNESQSSEARRIVELIYAGGMDTTMFLGSILAERDRKIDSLRSRLKEVEGEFADMKAACESGKCSDLIEAREREANLENIIVICASNGCPLCSLPATQESAPKAQEKKS
jgi:DNA-binding FrmR family transcriptional regulator